MIEQSILPSQLVLALSWEGEKPIPYHFQEPLHLALREAINEIKQPKDCPPVSFHDLISAYQPPELGTLLKEIIYDRHQIYIWDWFEANSGSWWEGGPLRPRSKSYFQNLKAEMRQRLGEEYETLVRHFVPHFQRLAPEYLPERYRR